jgi:hypothetical protein
MSAQEMAAWWDHARRHFEVPGSKSGSPDERGLTWTAHLWRRGHDRLIVFETQC